MISQINIKNLAIIDDISLSFKEGLNILTGETGAGKSIIIDAISLIFGARASSEMIQYGKEQAIISASFDLSSKKIQEIEEITGFSLENEFFVQRIINQNGKNQIKINGINVALSTLNQISEILVDISGQFESMYLLNSNNHIKLLDSYVLANDPSFLDKYKEEYKKYQSLLKEKNELMISKNSNVDVEYLEFKINELKDYNYTLDDVISLEDEYKKLSSISSNVDSINTIINQFENDNDGVSKNLYQTLKNVSRLNVSSELSERLNSIYLDLEDFIETFKDEYSSSSFDQDRYDFVVNEITRINKLKRKYNVNDLLAYKNELLEQIESINNYQEKLDSLERMIDNQVTILNKIATIISNTRKEYAIKLEEKIMQEFKDLFLNEATFKINFEQCDFTNVGRDKVTFMLQANEGSYLQPLAKVASGGEVSRILLGLKSFFTSLSDLDLIIFDEIDSGVSGKVGLAMGKKMQSISLKCQVLAITHLPTVAAMSSHHFYIYKENVNGITNTKVKPLNDDEKILEVARLLSGNEISETFINSAKELISLK